MKWRPIETAPKHRMWILGWDGKDLAIIEFLPFAELWMVVHDTGDYYWADYSPTHWMPLPEPPEKKHERGR